MRSYLLMAALLASCTTSLQQGDRAFTHARWGEAQQAWSKAAEEKEADVAGLLFRRALLHARPGTDLYDPAETRRIFERLEASHQETPWGLAARLWLERQRATEVLDARIAALETELAGSESARVEAVEALVLEREVHHARELLFQEQLLRLEAELGLLRAERADVAALEEKILALEEELEAMKSIDLRR